MLSVCLRHIKHLLCKCQVVKLLKCHKNILSEACPANFQQEHCWLPQALNAEHWCYAEWADTFLVLMNCTHSSQVVRKGCEHRAHWPQWDSMSCSSGYAGRALDTTDNSLVLCWRISLAESSWTHSTTISSTMEMLKLKLTISRCLFLMISDCFLTTNIL